MKQRDLLMNARLKKIFTIIILGTLLTGCAAATTAISKRELVVQTKMSSTIFLDPVSTSKRTVYLQLRNTSDKPSFDIAEQVKQAIINKGYVIKNNPDDAHFLIQANILQVGLTSQTAAEKSLLGGYGDIAAGTSLGAALGSYGRSNSLTGGLVGGLVMGGGSLVANSLVKDVYYSVTTDMQLSVKTRNGVKVTNNSHQNLVQGTSGSTVSTYEETTDRKRYQTRILSSANKVNLKWEQASPELVRGLVRSMTGML